MGGQARKLTGYNSRMAKRKVAIFDIDGTIFRSSLLIELVNALIENGVFPRRITRFYRKEYLAWLERRGSYEDYIRGVIRAFDKHIKGVRKKDFLAVVRQVIRVHEKRVYRYTRDLLKELKRKGYFLLAVSHSPGYVVHHFAKQAGFDKVYGRMYEVGENGRFTGTVLHADIINDKRKAVLRAVEKERLTLKGSTGVGDTEADISFLKLVQKPICFNPNSVLYRFARRNGWRIVVERKDVIYKISKFLSVRRRKNP